MKTRGLAKRLKQGIYTLIFNFRWSMKMMKLKQKRSELRWQRFMKKAGICEKCWTHTAHVLFILLLLTSPANAHPIDMKAIAQIESSGNPEAVGASGEIGLYQISPIVLKHFNQANNGKVPANFNIRLGDLWGSGVTSERLKETFINEQIANWYMNWLFDRTWTVKDTLIAWNWGIGNWRNWHSARTLDRHLPRITQDYLKKYEKLTGEVIS